MSIRLKLDDTFRQLAADVEKAGAKAETIAAKCGEAAADAMQDAMVSEMQKADVDKGLVARLPPPEVENDHGRVSVRVGYKKGAYDPQNPSDGYKAVFLNYGTPRRTKHGKVAARGFIDAAKKKAKSAIKRKQTEALQEIMEGLK